MFLSNFSILRPKYESKQEDTLRWLAKAHTKDIGNQDFQEKLERVACKPEHIKKRGHVLDTQGEQDEIHNAFLFQKMQKFSEEADAAFSFFYPEMAEAPDAILHVTCTGYTSPSAAQKIVSKRGWGKKTEVTHCYHMGCYGSIPAIRIASALCALRPEKKALDIVHTEICSLHTSPISTEIGQIISQTLFADGFIKYQTLPSPSFPSLKVIEIKEEIIPSSLDAMTWDIGERGFVMSLAKEIPVLIRRHLNDFLSHFSLPPNTFYAIHPGGPKILNYIQKHLNLSYEQMRFSYEILKNFGNMSSATLPHIWQKILESPDVPYGSPVMSLAFGPGLTISGILLEKQRCG